MNNIEKITSKIIADAESYAKEVTANCEEQCARTLETGREKAAAVYAEETARCKRECESIIGRSASSSEVLDRNILLDAKNAKIDEVFRLAGEKLTKLPEDVYLGFLVRNLKTAIDSIDAPEDDGFGYAPVSPELYTVALNSIDAGRFGEKLIKELEGYVRKKKCRITLSGMPAEISGGFLLKRCDTEINSSFEALMREARENFRHEVSEVLFGNG